MLLLIVLLLCLGGIVSSSEVVEVNLTVSVFRFRNSPIEFNTRGYNVDSDASPIGPEIRVKPGDTLRIRLKNTLGLDSDGPNNWFKLANTTNLHLHGMHLSPEEDDVYTPVLPGTEKIYTYNIPEDHSPGTAWYHPHVHGSSSLQQGGGMAGALIVEDVKPFFNFSSEHVLMFQQLCFRDLGKYKDSVPYMNHLNVVKYGLDNVVVNPVYNYPDQEQDFVLTNGVYMPNITISSSEWTRLRMINANTNAFLSMHIESTSSSNSTSPCEMYVLAKDGIYVPSPSYNMTHHLLIPGSRLDVGVRCSQSGKYRLVSKPNSGAIYDSELAQTTVVHDGTLLNIEVHHSSMENSVASPPPSTLPKRPSYLPSLLQNVTQNSSQTFSVSFHTIGGPFSFGPPFPSHLINGKAWTNENDYVANITLGRLQDWYVGIEGDSDVGAGNHPYHQHVNPFQVVDLGVGLTEYLGIRVGEYRDTIPLTSSAQYHIRFIPDRFKGRSLLHCHMVPHIDLGMAAVVSINDE
jgi:FtsP/CotA-like multicopper oxidase with cupredoxin domain